MNARKPLFSAVACVCTVLTSPSTTAQQSNSPPLVGGAIFEAYVNSDGAITYPPWAWAGMTPYGGAYTNFIASPADNASPATLGVGGLYGSCGGLSFHTLFITSVLDSLPCFYVENTTIVVHAPGYSDTLGGCSSESVF